MRRRFWTQPLRRQLLMANLLVLIPAAALTVWSARSTLRESEDGLSVQAQTFASTTAAMLDQELPRGDQVTATRRVVAGLHALRLPQGAVVSVADAGGRVLARNVEEVVPAGNSPIGTGGSVPSGTALHTGADGVERLFVDAKTGAGSLTVSVGLPRQLAINRAAPIWTRHVLLLSFAFISSLALTWFLAGRLKFSVEHFDAVAGRIASGDFSPIVHEPMHSTEFARLQTAFDVMLQRFNASRNALDAQMGEERRIRQELQSLQGQVIRQERLAAVGQLVSGVAHEINNPLQAILGFAELLQMQPDVPDTVKTDLRLIQKESARACGIIRNLALFARQQPAEAAPVLLSDVIRAVAELRQRRLESEDIQLQIDDQATRPVNAILTELQQVVLNFVVNAEQAILSSGRLPGRITIRSYDRDERLILEVEDTGPGIAPENEAKLFQPFFTTKPVGQGTGLGLSVSYGIIESHGGVIGYRRAPAGGAIFYGDLPAA